MLTGEVATLRAVVVGHEKDGTTRRGTARENEIEWGEFCSSGILAQNDVVGANGTHWKRREHGRLAAELDGACPFRPTENSTG